MARGNGFTAAALNINIGANSAQLSAAIDKAKATVQGFAQQSASHLQKLSKAFGAVGNAAMGMGPSIANAAGSVTRGAAVMAAGMSVYTGAVVMSRLEQEKLAKQFNLTSEQMNALAYMAKYAGQETEDFADALKELSIKAGDVIEAGNTMSDTMGVFFGKMEGGAKKWVGENDPIKKLYALREAWHQLSLAEQVRVADEMGDPGLKLISTLKLANAEFEMLRKTGEATANAMNTDSIQTLISKFGYLTQVGNDFLTAIVARFAPMFSMICEEWTEKLTSAFESKGGFKEGFESYVDEWADKIFTFLMNTISNVASFTDSLRNIANGLVSAYNSTINMADNVMETGPEHATFQKHELKGDDQRAYKVMDMQYRKYEKNKAIAESTRAELLAMEAANDKDKLNNDKRYKELGAKMRAAEASANHYQVSGQFDKYKAFVHVQNLKQQVEYDPNAAKDTADKIRADAEAKWKETKDKIKQKDNPPTPNKPTKTISEQAFANSQKDAGAKAQADLEKSTAALQAKLESQMKKIQAIRDKFKSDQQANWDKTVNAEKQELSDSFVDAEQIINDHYAERLKTVKKGTAEELKLQREMNDKKMDLALIQAEAEKQLQEDQQTRYKIDSVKFMKDMREQHEDVMTKLGKRGVGGIQGGTVGQQNQIREETKQLEKQYQNQLDMLEAEYGKQNALYEEMLDKKTEALKAQQAKEAALMAAHGEGMGHDLRRMYTAAFGAGGMEEAFSERQSVVEGYTNAEIGMLKSHSDEVVGNDANAIAQRKQMDEDAQNARMMFMADGMSQITAMGAKNNKALFFAQKAITLAMIAMNTMMGASQAMKLGPEGLPMVPMFYAMGAAQAAQVLATTFIQGQAHDGIDYIPADGTWNLQKGERIVDNRLNVRLDQAVEKINTGNYSTGKGNITITMPMNIQGDVMDRGWFASELEYHRDTLAEQVAKYNDDRGVNN
ncbi:TPA: hypothetical protein SIA39_004118 [Aeromonas sobria]|nr:hypothetical protein [Aeromonas sobria]